MKAIGLIVVALSGTALAAQPAVGQLGGRPAEEWAITLESGRRMEGLEIENVVRRLGLRAGDVVADIGAGTGIFSIPLATTVGPTGRVLAVEVDAGFLPMIADKARAANLPNVETVLGEFGDPELPRSDIDLAFFHDVLHHIQERPEYLQAMSNYMSPGGRIAIVDYDAANTGTPHQDEPAMLITPAEVDAWMRDAGFQLGERIPLFEEKFFVIYTRTD